MKKDIVFEWQNLPDSLRYLPINSEKTKQLVVDFLTEKAKSGYIAVLVNAEHMLVLFKIEKEVVE